MAGLASAAGPPWGPSLQDALQPDPLDAPTPFTPAPLAPWRTMGVRASACGRHGNSHLGVPALQTGELGLREVTGLELGWRRQNLALGALPTTVRGPPVISGTQSPQGQTPTDTYECSQASPAQGTHDWGTEKPSPGLKELKVQLETPTLQGRWGAGCP